MVVVAIAMMFYWLYWRRRRFSPVLSRHDQTKTGEMDVIPGMQDDDADLMNTHDIEVVSYEI